VHHSTVFRFTVLELEESGLEYILGLRMRRDKDGDRVLETRGRYRVVEENLHVKEASVDGKRYILCYNPDEAKRQKQTREHGVEKLKRQIQTGVKSLVKNRQYRRLSIYTQIPALRGHPLSEPLHTMRCLSCFGHSSFRWFGRVLCSISQSL
jgi:hypothetical protein